MPTSATRGIACDAASSNDAGFVHDGLPRRVAFGALSSRSQLAVELRDLHAERVLFLGLTSLGGVVEELSRQIAAEFHVEAWALGDTTVRAVSCAARSHHSDVVVAIGAAR